MNFISCFLTDNILRIYRFADRDMVMRFRGGGVGHKSTRDATNFFKTDRDLLDNDRHHASVDSNMENESETTDATCGESEEEPDSNRDGNGKDDDEEGDYGYVRDVSEDDSDKNTGQDSDQELSDDMFGPEGANCAMDNDMDELGYADF